MAARILYLFHPMTDTRPDMPNRVREHRLAAGKTLTQLAEACGMSPQMLGFIERGLRDMRYLHQTRIAEALGLQPADLLSERDHSYALTQDERALVEHYRKLDAQGRRAVRGVAETLTAETAAPTEAGRKSA